MARERAFRFSGTDSAYIRFLEEQLLQYTTCNKSSPMPWSPPTPSSPSTSLVTNIGVAPSNFSSGEVDFIQYKPDSSTSSTPQWIGKSKVLLRNTPKAHDWWATLAKGKLDSVNSNHFIITCLLEEDGLHSSSTVMSITTNCPRTTSQVLMERVTRYAAVLQNYKSIMTKVQALQRFIFVCLCVVLQAEGVATDQVNSVMRMLISDTGGKYLERVRKGVMWMNTLIDDLAGIGWGSRASELLMLWNKQPTYYSDFGDYWDASKESISQTLSRSEFTAPVQAKEEWTAIFIPSIVCQLLGNSVSTVKVAKALGYRNSVGIEPDGSILVQHPWTFFTMLNRNNDGFIS